MKKKFFKIPLFLLILVAAFPAVTACSNSSTSKGGSAEFEVIRQAADAWVNNGKPLNITAETLYNGMMQVMPTGYSLDWYHPTTYTTGPVVVDVRSWSSEMPDAYPTGHIPGSISIPWREITQWQNLNKLPKDRPITVYSDTGETGAAVAAILNVLGYPVTNLEWGMTSWTSNPTVAPGAYDKLRDTVWDWGGSYRAVCPISEPTDVYDLPVVNDATQMINRR